MDETSEKESSASRDDNRINVEDKNPVGHSGKSALQEVLVIRNWKEYLGESLLIVFSVLLALILTEIINKIHEDRQTSVVLRQLSQELKENKRLETEQLAYHHLVLRNIDSALKHPEFANQFISNGEISLSSIAPMGILLHDLNNVAWELAKQNNIFPKLDLTTYGLLTNIYDQQQRITNSEDKMGVLILSYQSRKVENIRNTLILLRDNFRGWDVDRAPNLLNLYQEAINKLKEY